jgi:hypothetical protein
MPIEKTVERWQYNPQHPTAFSPPPQAFQAGPAWQSLPLPAPLSHNVTPSQAFFDGAHDFHWEGDFHVDARQYNGARVNNITYYNAQNPQAATVNDLQCQIQQPADNIGMLKLLWHTSCKR